MRHARVALQLAVELIHQQLASRDERPPGALLCIRKQAITMSPVTTTTREPSRLPAVYLSHGAPPLVDDPVWIRELTTWGQQIPRPQAILVVSAHWESAPLTIGATTSVPLVYDFYGFPKRYYDITYPSPGAPDLAERVRRLVTDLTPVAEDPTRGLDHGAYVPLLFMYPEADVHKCSRFRCPARTRASCSKSVGGSLHYVMRAC